MTPEGMREQIKTPSPALEASLAIDEKELFYRVYGDGEPLLLLHGFFGTGEYWEPLIPALAANYRLIVPDLLGHGRSSNPSGVFTHRQAASDVVTLLDHLGVARTRAAGFSSGAETLLHIAVREPARLGAQVLIGATHYETEATRAIARQWTFEALSPGFLELLKAIHPGGEVQIRALSDQFRAAADDLDDMSFTPAHLAQVRSPTLLIVGDRDEFMPLPVMVEMYTHIPDAYLWVVPNGNHMLHIDSWGGRFPGREALSGVVLDFLDGGWGDAG